MDKYSGDGVLGNDKIPGVAKEVGGWTGGDTDEAIDSFIQQIFWASIMWQTLGWVAGGDTAENRTVWILPSWSL